MLLERLTLQELRRQQKEKTDFYRALQSVLHRVGTRAWSVRLREDAFLPLFYTPWPGLESCALLVPGALSARPDESLADWSEESLRLILNELARTPGYSAWLISIPSTETAFGKLLTSQGFTHLNPEQAFLFGDEASRMQLYYRRRVDIKEEAWGLLPYPRGFLAVYGDALSVTESLFLSFSETLAPGRLRETLALFDCLDPHHSRIKTKTQLGDMIKLAEGFLQEQRELPSAVYQALCEAQEYFYGRRRSFEVPIRFAEGTQFQLRVWNQLKQVQYGETLTYTDLAQRTLLAEKNLSPKDPQLIRQARSMTRAVGAACSANPLSLFVPCHRIIGMDGKLVGYKDGLDIKDFLLNLELLGAHL